jgi:hypothetical protein
MASPITQQYKEELGLLDGFAKEIESEWLAAKIRGDTSRADEAMRLFQKLETEERPKLDQKYQDLQLQRKKELIDGVASGDLITDKRTVSAFFPTNYGELYQPSEEELTRTKTVATFNPKKTKSILSELLEVPENKIDVESGLGTGITTQLELLRDPDAMEYQLKENLKFPTVIRQVINGKPNFIVEDSTGVDVGKGEKSNYKVVFPDGIQGADVVAFMAAQTAPTIASIAGAIGGGTAGTATGTPFGIGVGAVMGSGAAYAATTSTQDALARANFGVPINAGEILSTRGKETLYGMGIDVLTLGVGSELGVGKLGREGIENAVAKSLREAEELLVAKGNKVSVPEGYITGTKGGEWQRGIAGGSPDMEVAKQMIRQQVVASDFKEAAIKGAPVVDKIGTLEMIRKNLINTADILSSKADKIAGMPKAFAERRLARLMPDKTNWVEGGKGMSEVLTKGQEMTKQLKNAEFENFAKASDAAGVSQSPDEVAALLRPIVENSRGGVNPMVNDIYTRLGNASRDAQDAAMLRNQIAQLDNAGQAVPPEMVTRLAYLDEYSQPFNAKTSRDLIQKLQAQVPGSSYGGDMSDEIARQATKAVRGNFEGKLEQTGMKGEWDKFREAYVDYSAYQKGDIGKMVTDNFGDLKIAPEEVLKRSLKDTKSVSDILNAAKAAGDVEGEAYLRSTMRKAYIEQTGLTSKQGLDVNKSDFNDEMIDVLFGAEAPRLKESLRDLNQSLAASKVKTANIDPKDADQLLRPMPLNDRKKLIAEITDKATKQEAFDSFVKNEIVQKVKKGDFRHVDNIIYGEAMMDAKPSDVLEIVGKMSPKMKQSTGADMMAAFFKKFEARGEKAGRFEIFNSPAAGKAAGKQLWDHQEVIKSLGDWNRGKGGAPAWVNNMDAVTGSKEMADELIAFSRVAESNRLLGNEEFLEMRGMVSGTGAKFYTAPFEYLGHKIMATAYGSNKLKPALRYMRKNIGEAEQQKAMEDMVRGIVTTRTGIQAAMQQAQNDPEFSEQFQNIMLKVKEDIDRERQQQR